MSATGTIAPTPGNSRLIRIYYLYRTNIPKVFNALFESFLTSKKDMALVPSVPEENNLIVRLTETMNESFPVPKSMISMKFGGQERLLLNAIQRVFGYHLPMEKFPVSTTINTAFHSLTDSIFKNIALGIVGRTSTLLDFKNPGGLLEYLTMLQRSLLTNEVNMTNFLSNTFDLVCTRYLELLKDDLLMSKLGIVGAGPDQRLLSMAMKFRVPVVRNPLVFFDLAELISNFIEIVETTTWTLPEVSKMYEPPISDNMKLLFSAYAPIWGIDYMSLAMGTIRQSISPSMSSIRTNY